MIILSNGDKWITDDKEWEKPDIPYEEACEGKIPETTVREFVEYMCSSDYSIPRKLIDMDGMGYWDANSDWAVEVLADAAVRKATNDWGIAYEMPWGHVIVVSYRPDCGGCDAEKVTTVLNSADEYMEKAALK